ncbi:MAG: hypothetical protein WC563_09905 [Brevundimonas sp.]|jgi:hypothetical protein|uniref:hypothetical protein n=1 Tax=Brevundimonas sp. Leaf280 TaxID=1736320 RepID=UPI0006FF2F5D|nr:hypothetical protein [Brevundimonas sp. Leaf280]KQP46517.1 hypothetical protein ASF31_04700 [Brevundimonas sp. Leaf280]
MSPTLAHIRLTLAREPGHPVGDPETGYDLIAVVDHDGRLDAAGCKAAGEHCRIRRFEGGQTVAFGHLRPISNHRWILDFDPGEKDDQIGFRFDDASFLPGAYVSLTGGAGEQHTYCVSMFGPVVI